MVSVQVLATPIMGRARSSSVKPMALSIARAPARSRPSVITRLCCLGSDIIVTSHCYSGLDMSKECKHTASDSMLLHRSCHLAVHTQEFRNRLRISPTHPALSRDPKICDDLLCCRAAITNFLGTLA